MAKYVYKTPSPLEAIEWVDINLEEIKVFLGENFIKVDEENILWFYRRNSKGSVDSANLNEDVIVKNKDYFWSERAEEFYDEWELVE